jgi:hypothetical protein
MSKAEWEYKVIMSHGISDERTMSWTTELNKCGAEGWELVSVIVRPDVPAYEDAGKEDMGFNLRVARTVAFLKRQKA